MSGFFTKIRDWFKLTFWDKVSLRFDHANDERVLVTIRPRLIQRILNKIEVGQAWMERHENSAGFATWVGKIKIEGVSGILLIHRGYLLHARLERAYRSNKQKNEVLPDSRLLMASVSSDNQSKKELDDLN